MRETCHEVLEELKLNNSLLEVAMELENIALNDPYFIEKNCIQTWTSIQVLS